MAREKNLALWGEDLFNAFWKEIDEDGWLTDDWATILEDNFSNWDENYNDTNEKGNLYSIMYNTDFETSVCGDFIRPVKEDEDE